MHKRWVLGDVREAHHSRFLLRPSALELFMLDSSTALLNFPSAKVRNSDSLAHTSQQRRSVPCMSLLALSRA